MPYYFNAQDKCFYSNGVRIGDAIALSKEGRLRIDEATHKLYFDGQIIGELDSSFKFTRIKLDTATGNLYIDGLNHGSLMELFFCNFLNLGSSRERFEIAVIYSQVFDYLLINGHFIGKINELYANSKLVVREDAIYYIDIPIGYPNDNIRRFNDIKLETNKLSLNGSKPLPMSDHIKNGTVVMRTSGFVQGLGNFDVDANTTDVKLNKQSLGSLGLLMERNMVQIRNDKLLTYNNTMTVGELDDLLERRQLIIAGLIKYYPKLSFYDKDQQVFLDSLYLGKFPSICSKKEFILDADRQLILYADIPLGYMPATWRDYQIKTVNGGYIASEESLGNFQRLYFGTRNNLRIATITNGRRFPHAFIDLYYYANSTHIEVVRDSVSVYENGVKLGSIEEVLQSSRLRLREGRLSLEEDIIAYLVLDRANVISNMDGTFNINGSKKTFLQCLRENIFYIHTSPFEYGIFGFNDERLVYHQGGIWTINGRYFLTMPRNVSEHELGLTAKGTISNRLSDEKIRMIFLDSNRILAREYRIFTNESYGISESRTNVDHSASTHQTHSTGGRVVKRMGFFINREKRTLEYNDGRSLGDLSGLFSSGSLKINWYRGFIEYNGERVCMISPSLLCVINLSTLTANDIMTIFYSTKYDLGSKSFYQGNNSLGHLSNLVSQGKLTIHPEENKILFNNEYLTYLPTAHRKFDYEVNNNKAITSYGPLLENYLYATTNNRFVNTYTSNNYIQAMPLVEVRNNADVYDLLGNKMGYFEELLKRGRVTFRPRYCEMEIDGKIAGFLIGDLDQYKLQYSSSTHVLNSCDIKLVVHCLSRQMWNPRRIIHVGVAGDIYKGNERSNLWSAINNGDVSASKERKALLFRGEFFGRLPGNYKDFGVTIDNRGKIGCKILREFLAVYQTGQREHFGGIYDMDYATGMVYLRDYPIGTLYQLASRGNIIVDRLRRTVLINGHFFCPLLTTYRALGLEYDKTSGLVSSSQCSALTLLHMICSNDPNICTPDYHHIDVTEGLVYTGEKYAQRNVGQFAQSLRTNENESLLLSDGQFVCFLPERPEQHGFEVTGRNNEINVRDMNAFARYLSDYMLEWRLLRLSGEYKLHRAKVDHVNTSNMISFDGYRKPVDIAQMMTQQRIWYDTVRQTFTADGVYFGRLIGDVQLDPIFHSLVRFGGAWNKNISYTEEDLQRRSWYILHDKNLNQLTVQGRLVFESKLGVIFLDGTRVGGLSPEIFHEDISVNPREARILKAGKDLGTVQQCFDRAMIRFEFELMRAAQEFKENKSFLINGARWGSFYKDFKREGTMEFFDLNRTDSRLVEGMNIQINTGQKIPREIIEFTLKEIRNTYDDKKLEKDLAKPLKLILDQKYGRVWQVIVSRSTIGCKVSHFEDMFMNIEYRGLTFIMFRTPDYN
ncbi:hypothetical protein Ciccas_007274 [Cichlidogyrus casuarinus]|uniref:Uncharacterized protein n=1 Tax=Cichlidogyrus casuarinus TaxID=1844966 RepID=A0ABD2Q417_9PLAT